MEKKIEISDYVNQVIDVNQIGLDFGDHNLPVIRYKGKDYYPEYELADDETGKEWPINISKNIKVEVEIGEKVEFHIIRPGDIHSFINKGFKDWGNVLALKKAPSEKDIKAIEKLGLTVPNPDVAFLPERES